ncbi:MAG TPA: hypothetical protein VK699_10855 [Terriglobales bacterium]|nr:hypothetical protein [Terriglobales bacterium]
MKASLLFCKNQVFAAVHILTCCLLLCAAATTSSAQTPDAKTPDAKTPDAKIPGGAPSVRAGGNWRAFDSEDKMTAVHRVTFELLSDNAPAENDGFQYKIDFTCEKGKLKYSEFTPSKRLGPPDHPGFWGQPQMEVTVRVDSSHSNHGWNWDGDSLSMDKGTIRELIGAQIFKIEFQGRRGSQIAEFSPDGLDLSRVSQACGLAPKQP